MQRTTKTFIGGFVIGSIIASLATYLLLANNYINTHTAPNYELQILSEIRDTLNVSTCYQLNDTYESAQQCIND